MIRDSIKNEILNSLNFSAFRMEDFLISYPYAENIYRIIIEYDEYFFYININVNELFNWVKDKSTSGRCYPAACSSFRMIVITLLSCFQSYTGFWSLSSVRYIIL